MILWRCRYWKCKEDGKNRIIRGKKLEECIIKGCRHLQSFIPNKNKST